MTVRPLHNLFSHLLFIEKSMKVVQKMYLLPKRCHGCSLASVTALDSENSKFARLVSTPTNNSIILCFF